MASYSSTPEEEDDAEDFPGRLLHQVIISDMKSHSLLVVKSNILAIVHVL